MDKLKPYDVEEAYWPIKLDANEMPDGFTARLQTIIAETLRQVPLNRYPEIAASNFRQVLAQGLGISRDNVLAGNGSSELLGAICHAFGGPGRSILYPAPSFSMYGVYARLSDSEPVSFSLDEDFHLPAERFLQAAKAAKASLVILCNPNNPTGTVMPEQDIEYIVANAGCPVVVDEAYYEFYGQTSLALLDKYPNLIITRTFSKAYGLAACRIGYLAAGKDIAGVVGKILLPYHVNALSLAVAAAVYHNKAEVMAAVSGIVAERERLAALLTDTGDCRIFKSDTNFLLVKTAKATALAAALAARGIGIRDFSKYPGLEGCIRITVGTASENNEAAEAIGSFFKARVEK